MPPVQVTTFFGKQKLCYPNVFKYSKYTLKPTKIVMKSCFRFPYGFDCLTQTKFHLFLNTYILTETPFHCVFKQEEDPLLVCVLLSVSNTSF